MLVQMRVFTLTPNTPDPKYPDPKYRQVPHRTSSISHVLTVSMGVSTIIPAHDDDPINFVEQVARLLYQAKQAGRNCSIVAEK